ncbi:hypothetical protein D3C86_1446340 [compost metagenome]
MVQGFWRLGGSALLTAVLVSGCALLPASRFAFGGGSPDAFLRDARIMVNDPNANLASPIETLTIDEARRRYYVVSFDFRSDERAYVLTLSPSNEGFTTVNNSFGTYPDGSPVTYTSVTAIYAERDRTLLAVHKRNGKLEADVDAMVDTRLSSGSRLGTTHDPSLHASVKSLANAVVMERNELSLGDTYRAMGWTDGSATVEMRMRTRDEVSSETVDLAKTSLITTASSDGMFAVEGILNSEYAGGDRLRKLYASDICQIPFAVNGQVVAVHLLTVRPPDEIGKPPQPMPSSMP